MIAEAARSPSSRAERYEVADAAQLPFADGSFELVTLNNMIPFFDEVARVTAPGGHVAVAFALGAATPIYVPLERVRRELERARFRARCGLLAPERACAPCPQGRAS